ncbi:MAG TPA: ABC transporter ATP-binding protein [Symbiobacteriaceae bacterium]|jgi:ABC-2 type transport system ATP-binding protein
MLQVTELTKSFGRLMALYEVSLQVARGELVGLVGPDGAGKTTLLRLLAGALEPTYGDIEVDVDRERIGYLSAHFSLYPDLTVWENVEFFAQIHGLHDQAARRRGKHLLEWVGLAEFRNRLAAQLSGGMKQKLSLACVLLHPTDLLLLDEPTTGVDPISRREFWEMINALVSEGTTVLLSTSYLEEAARCHRVAFLHQGKLLACDDPQRLIAQFPHTIMELRAPGVSRATLEEAARRFPSLVSAYAFGDVMRLSLSQALTDHQRQLAAYVTGVPGLEARPITPSLEDVFAWMLPAEGVGS